MSRCPICEHETQRSAEACARCGYSFGTGLIAGRDALLALAAELKGANDWQELVRLKLRVHEAHMAIYGMKTSSRERPGWSLRETGNLFGETHANIDKDLTVARALQAHPALAECPNKSLALRRLSHYSYPSGDVAPRAPFELESDLHRFLAEHAAELPCFRGWTLVNPRAGAIGKYPAGDGIIDILLKHEHEERWLVVELKRDQSGDAVVGQVLRYMGWVAWTLAGNDLARVDGAIVCPGADDSMVYAALCVPNLQLFEYAGVGGQFALRPCNVQQRLVSRLLSQMPPDQLQELQDHYRRARATDGPALGDQ